MRIFRYWSRAEMELDPDASRGSNTTEVRGWSDRNQADADAMARERVERRVRWWRTRDPAFWEKYPYTDRPICEPIVDEQFEDGRRVMAVTQNAYGCYVLNTAGLFFADVDTPPLPVTGRLREAWLRWRGRGRAIPTPEETLIERVDSLAVREGLRMRLYRTRAGHRVAVTSRAFDPTSAESRGLLEALGSDPLYVRMCEAQACYRARPNPKPWRIGIDPQGAQRYPWRDDRVRAEHERWTRKYEQAAGAWATCEPVGDYGVAAPDRGIAPLLAMHDALSCGAGKPLA